MNSDIQNAVRTFTAGEALSAHRRVKLSGVTVVYADAGEAAIGVTTQAIANAAAGPVRLLNAAGTFNVTAATTITAGATVYGADDGKISATASGKPFGTSLEAGSADDGVEVLPDTWQDFLTQYDCSGL